MTRRRWIADTLTASTAALRGDQAQHLIRVLRARAGMQFDVVVDGHAWLGRIASIEDDTVIFDLLSEVETASEAPLTLVLSIFKFDRMEWAIEKAVELGCTRILPVVAQRTEKHLAQAAPKRVDRWRRIALEAAKQSRRSDLPEIASPLPLDAALRDSTPQDEARILLAETEGDHLLLRTLDACAPAGAASVSLAIGPEGGWTAAELSAFAQSGWTSASLGPRILRAESAAIAGLAILSAWQQAHRQ